jgi:hypothetical protein
MFWESTEADADKKALGQALVARVPRSGWRSATLSAASEATFSDAAKWQQIFPRGSRDAIWYISEVSDASMRFPFLSSPAPNMSTVIITRLSQNEHLKPFVRRVMLFDVFHPVQAFSRMQRTSHMMFACLRPGTRNPSLRLITGLNIIYTAIVFFWLLDPSNGNECTKRMTRQSMRLIGMS